MIRTGTDPTHSFLKICDNYDNDLKEGNFICFREDGEVELGPDYDEDSLIKSLWFSIAQLRHTGNELVIKIHRIDGTAWIKITSENKVELDYELGPEQEKFWDKAQKMSYLEKDYGASMEVLDS